MRKCICCGNVILIHYYTLCEAECFDFGVKYICIIQPNQSKMQHDCLALCLASLWTTSEMALSCALSAKALCSLCSLTCSMFRSFRV